MTRLLRSAAVAAVVSIAALALPAVASAVAVAPPTVTSSPAAPEVYLGESTTVVVEFDNNDGGAAPGFGPYLDVLIRTADASGDAGHGLSINGPITLGAGGPTLASQTIPCTGVAFPHPVAMTAPDVPALVLPADCPVGSSFVFITLPFGSFTSTQPSAQVQIPLLLSSLANIGGADDLPVQARGGYRFGGTPIADPATDPTVTGAFGAGTLVSPTLLDVKKVYLGPENETATGPNYPRQYRFEGYAANGQQIDLAELGDVLPDGIVVTGVTATGGGALTYGALPLALPFRSDGVSELSATWASVTGTGPGAAVQSVTVDFFVPNLRFAGAELLPSGADRSISNDATFSGSWTPAPIANDGLATPVSDSTTAPLVVEAAAIVIQKSRVAPASPQVGSQVQYAINGQVSDYYALDDIVVTDSMSDGVKIDTGVAPVLTVFRGGAPIHTTPFDPANYAYTSRVGNPGTRDLQAFDVGQQLFDDGVFGAADELGVLRGGCVPAAPALYDPTAAFESTCAQGALTFRITYEADVLASYEEEFGGKLVVARDDFDNTASATGNVRDTNTAGWPDSGTSSTNGTGNSFALAGGAVDKRIFAVNGVECWNVGACAAAAANIVPGDTITYYVSKVVPAPGVDDLRMSDFLPLPVLRVTGGTPTLDLTPVANDAAVAVDEVRPYTGVTGLPVHTYSDPTATISSSVAGNSFTIDWDSTPTTLAAGERIALLAKFTVNTDPFADGLRLTNQLSTNTDSSVPVTDRLDSYAEFTLRQPELELVKGVGPTDNPVDDTFSGTVAGVTAAGTPVALTGAPVSTATAQSWDSNVSNLDGSDRVRYVVSVSNTGGAPADAVTLCDTRPPAGMVGGATPTVSNFTVIDQTGAARVLTGGEPAFFDCGAPAVLSGTLPAAGTLFVIYDLQVDHGPTVRYTPMTNTAEVQRYENVGSALNFLGSPLTDIATVTATADIAVAKTFVDNITDAPIASPQSMTIGQRQKYRVRVSLDEAAYTNLTVVDTLAAGLAFTSDAPVVTTSSGLVTCLPTACGSVVGVKGGTDSTYTWNFSSVTNLQTDNVATLANREYIEIIYWVVVRDTAGNVHGASRANSVVATQDSCGGGAPEPACPGAQSVTANLVEPAIVPAKTVTPTVLDTDDVATWTLVMPVTQATAHEVRLFDNVPLGLTLVDGSLTIDVNGAPGPWTGVTNAAACSAFTVANAGTTCDFTDGGDGDARPDLDITWPTVAAGATWTITFQTTLDASAAVAGATITNTMAVDWRSLPDVVATLCDTRADCLERNYTASDPAAITVAVPTTFKEIVATSDPLTRIVPGPSHLAVGETAQYEVTIDFPEGETPSARIVDTVTAGLRFVSLDSIVLGPTTLAGELEFDDVPVSNATLAALRTAANVSADTALAQGIRTADGRQLRIDFGKVDNVGASGLTSTESIVIRYTVAATNVVGNQSGTSLSNSAVVSYGGTPTTPAVVLSEVVEPVLELAKTMTIDTTTIPGERLVRVDLAVSHGVGSTATAYDAAIADDLAGSGLEFFNSAAAGDNPVCNVTGVAVNCSAPLVAGDGISSSVDQLDIGETATLRFWARVRADHVVGTTIQNDGMLTWTSLAGDQRTSVCNVVASPDCIERNGAGGVDDYTDPDAETLVDPAVSATKVRTSPAVVTPPDRVVVGQRVTYRVDVQVPAGTTRKFRVVDTLDAGLAFPTADSNLTVTLPVGVTSAPVFTNPITKVAPAACDDAAAPCQATSVDGSMLEVWLGNVVNSTTVAQTITLTYDAVVANIPGVQAGVPAALDNAAAITHEPVDGLPVTITRDAQDVVPAEPELRIAKTLTDDLLVAAPDDLVRVQVTVDHAVGNTVTAHDVIVSDALAGTGLAFVDPNGATDPTCVGTGVACSAVNVVGSGATAVLSATATPLEAGDSIVLTFWAQVDSTHVVGTTITNTARADWTSMPGTVANTCGAGIDCSERTGVDGILGGGSLNDYRVTDSDTRTDPALAVAKSRTSPVPATTDDVVIGQTISYRVEVTVPPGTTQAVTLDDTLDEGLAFPGATGNTVVTPPAGVTTGAVTNVVGPALAGANTASRRLQIGMGDVVNSTAQPQVIVVTYDAIVRNELSVQDDPANATLDNIVGLDYTNNGPAITDAGESVDVTEPNVTITKSIIPALIDAGTVATIRLDLASTGNAVARGVVVEDLLPERMRRQGVAWVGGFTPTCTIAQPLAGAPAALGGDCTTTTVGLPLRDRVDVVVPDLAPGSTARIEFNVMLDTALAPGESVANTGRVDWRSLPIGQGDVDACPTAATCTGRTGADGEPGPGILNDYRDTDQDIAAGATTSSISGNVWNDANNDGVRDGGEACIDGVTVTLTGTDLLGNPVTAVAVTGGDVIDGRTNLPFVPAATSPCGAYEFDGLRPGTYTVTQTQPAGWLDGTEGSANALVTSPVTPGGSAGTSSANDTFTGIVLPAGSSSTVTEVDFGEIRPSSLAGRVWGEANGGPEDGVFNAGDTLLGGVTVTLTGTDDRGPVSRTTTTAADGTYSFPDLRPGTYAVTQAQPVDWATGDSIVGTGPATPGVSGGTNSTTGIVIAPTAAGTTGIDYDFWELVRVDVAIDKQVVPTVPTGGIVGVNTTFTWRVRVTNNGPSVATSVAFTDDMAALAEQHLRVTAVTPQAGVTCGAWTQGAAPNLACVVASLARGASTWVDLTVRVDGIPAAAPDDLVNDVAITTLDQVDTNPTNNLDQDKVVARPSDVGVVKTGSATRLTVGEQVTWTLTVTNAGPGTDPAVQLVDTMPARSVLVSTTTSRGSCTASAVTGAVLTCALGEMVAGDVATVTIVAMLPEAGTYRNGVVVTPTGPDTNPDNHEDSHIVIVTVPGIDACTVEGDGVITGTSGDDIICGGPGPDIIQCGGGNNTIIGGGGNDVITCLGESCTGTNTILGGTGSDTIKVSCPGAIIDGGDGNDLIAVLGAGNGGYTLCGGTGNDVIRGGSGRDLIDGGPGTDQVFGNQGNDRLYGGTGNDLLDGGVGNDRLFGGIGNDRLFGRLGLDVLFGEAGNDQLDGGGGRDDAHGGDGNDVLRMRDRTADRIIGGRGRDTLYRDRAIDRWTTVEVVR
jgi:fimbrial isopeptide formation D2 family protein/uncharacterized repeat protein (TIGR01451 family)